MPFKIENFLTFKFFTDTLLSRGITLLIFIALIFLWVFTFSILGATLVLMLFLAFWIVSFVAFMASWFFATIGKAKEITFFLGIGTNLLVALIALAVGLLLGYLLVFAHTPLTVGLPLATAESTGLTDFIYRSINSPLLEDLFFRATLIPMLTTAIALIFSGKGLRLKWVLFAFVISLIAVNSLFGIAHWIVYGEQVDAIIGTIAWGIFATLLMFAFQTNLIAIGLHFGNNLPFVVGSMAAGIIIGVMEVLLIAAIILLLTRRKT